MNHFRGKNFQPFALLLRQLLQLRPCHRLDCRFQVDQLLILRHDAVLPVVEVCTDLFVANCFGHQELISGLQLHFKLIFFIKLVQLLFNFNFSVESFVDGWGIPFLFWRGPVNFPKLLYDIVSQVAVDGSKGLHFGHRQRID